MDKVYDKCYGIDLHKKFIDACFRQGNKQEIRGFGATTMESTASNWKPLYNILEPSDLKARISRAKPRSSETDPSAFGAFRANLPGYHTFLSLHLPAASTTCDSVQLLGFDLYGSLTLACSLLCSICSSGQRFARG